MKLSVIIPIYNVEATLKRCVLSVVDQQVDDMEVILVDDGSTDGSLRIAEELAAEHPKLRVMHEENGGLSVARNTGILQSSGEYVTFVDSDDWILENTYKPLLEQLEAHPECDILEYSVLKSYDGKVSDEIALPAVTYTSARAYWLEGGAYRHSYACNKLFRRSLFLPQEGGKMLFREGIVFEDVELMSRLLLHNPVIMTTPHLGYVYDWNPNGITATADGEKLGLMLKMNLRVARQLGLGFLKVADTPTPWVPAQEAPFYLYLLNIQITVRQRTDSGWSLPVCRVPLRFAKGFKMKMKVICLNLFGKVGV